MPGGRSDSYYDPLLCCGSERRHGSPRAPTSAPAAGLPGCRTERGNRGAAFPPGDDVLGLQAARSTALVNVTDFLAVA
jgi:hypothetical protein